MEKKEIVAKFIERGIQLDSDSLGYFAENEEKADEFLDKIKKTTSAVPTTITMDHVTKLLDIRGGDSVCEIELINKIPRDAKEKNTSVDDWVSLYNDRYEKVREILFERHPNLNPSSINKVQKQKEFSLIVMVREKDPIEKTLLIEDPTGETSAYLSKSGSHNQDTCFLEDDIVGVVCERRGERIEIKKVLWPDIPLKRDINKSNGDMKCIIISGLDPVEYGFDNSAYEKFLGWLNRTKFDNICILILDPLPKKPQDIETSLSNIPKKFVRILLPETRFKGHGRMEEGGFVFGGKAKLIKICEVVFLILNREIFGNYEEKWPEDDAAAISTKILKRRLVKNAIPSPVVRGEALVLEYPPDIVVSASGGEAKTSNYKGTTIISTGSFIAAPIFWIVDLKTREINKLDFS